MNARQKLNIAYLIGCFFVALLVGGLLNSDAAFVIAFGLAVVAQFASGNLRRRSGRR